jgi:hypothetical protein
MKHDPKIKSLRVQEREVKKKLKERNELDLCDEAERRQTDGKTWIRCPHSRCIHHGVNCWRGEEADR